MDEMKKVDNARNTRESETHDKLARRKPWRPVRKLETPPPPEGYEYRWIRESYLGQEDANNISYRLREGWEFVQGSELPEGWAFATKEKGRLAGVVHNEGLVLAKIPLETIEERRSHYEDTTRKANEALDNTMFNDSARDGRYVKYDAKRETQVTFGKK
jgi:hypothetical protein